MRKLLPPHATVAAAVITHKGYMQIAVARLSGIARFTTFDSPRADGVLKPLVHHLRTELPNVLSRHMMPDPFVHLSKIPVATSGK